MTSLERYWMDSKAATSPKRSMRRPKRLLFGRDQIGSKEVWEAMTSATWIYPRAKGWNLLKPMKKPCCCRGTVQQHPAAAPAAKLQSANTILTAAPCSNTLLVAPCSNTWTLQRHQQSSQAQTAPRQQHLAAAHCCGTSNQARKFPSAPNRPSV